MMLLPLFVISSRYNWSIGWYTYLTYGKECNTNTGVKCRRPRAGGVGRDERQVRHHTRGKPCTHLQLSVSTNVCCFVPEPTSLGNAATRPCSCKHNHKSGMAGLRAAGGGRWQASPVQPPTPRKTGATAHLDSNAGHFYELPRDQGWKWHTAQSYSCEGGVHTPRKSVPCASAGAQSRYFKKTGRCVRGKNRSTLAPATPIPSPRGGTRQRLQSPGRTFPGLCTYCDRQHDLQWGQGSNMRRR